MDFYTWRHVIGFEETSLVGNVYFANYLLWQGHCRELFLVQEAPEVVAALRRGEIALFTLNCSCDYCGGEGFSAMDEVLLHMHLEGFRGGRMSLAYTYYDARAPERVVARGKQEIACKARREAGLVAIPFPIPMIRALMRYTSDPALRARLQDALDFQGAAPGAPAIDVS